MGRERSCSWDVAGEPLQWCPAVPFCAEPSARGPGRGCTAATPAAGSCGVGAAGVWGVDGAEPGGETVAARGQLGSAVRRPVIHLDKSLDLDLAGGLAAARA